MTSQLLGQPFTDHRDHLSHATGLSSLGSAYINTDRLTGRVRAACHPADCVHNITSPMADWIPNMSMACAVMLSPTKSTVTSARSQHLATQRHDKIANLRGFQLPPMSSKKTPLNTVIHACAICAREFTSGKYLRMHIVLHRKPTPTGSQLVRFGVGSSSSSISSDGLHTPVSRKTSFVTHQMRSSTSSSSSSLTTENAESNWRCDVCGKAFAQNSKFKNHLRTHCDERPFVCHVCSIGFKERYHLKKHALFKHTSDLHEACSTCGKRFKDSTAVRAHERIHSERRPYACRHCGKAFKTSECLWHHDHRSKTCSRLKQQTSGTTELVETSMLASRASAGRHRAAPTSKKTLVGTLGSKINVQVMGLSGVAMAAQKQAEHLFGDERSTVHRMISTIAASEKMCQAVLVRSGEVPLPPGFDAHEVMTVTSRAVLSPTHTLHDNKPNQTQPYRSAHHPSGLFLWTPQTALANKPVAVVVGQHVTSSPSVTMAVMKTLTRKRGRRQKEVCSRCGKQFASQSAFERHLAVHNETRPYRCQLCDIGFKLKVHLKKHDLYRHTDAYPCRCGVCGKAFKDSSAVRLHERIHSTARPFQCACGKSFKTRENLWGHRNRRPCALRYGLESSPHDVNRTRCCDVIPPASLPVGAEASEYCQKSRIEFLSPTTISDHRSWMAMAGGSVDARLGCDSDVLRPTKTAACEDYRPSKGEFSDIQTDQCNSLPAFETLVPALNQHAPVIVANETTSSANLPLPSMTSPLDGVARSSSITLPCIEHLFDHANNVTSSMSSCGVDDCMTSSDDSARCVSGGWWDIDAWLDNKMAVNSEMF